MLPGTSQRHFFATVRKTANLPVRAEHNMGIWFSPDGELIFVARIPPHGLRPYAMRARLALVILF
jgi:hypothetical protein